MFKFLGTNSQYGPYTQYGHKQTTRKMRKIVARVTERHPVSPSKQSTAYEVELTHQTQPFTAAGSSGASATDHNRAAASPSSTRTSPTVTVRAVQRTGASDDSDDNPVIVPALETMKAHIFAKFQGN